MLTINTYVCAALCRMLRSCAQSSLRPARPSHAFISCIVGCAMCVNTCVHGLCTCRWGPVLALLLHTWGHALSAMQRAACLRELAACLHTLTQRSSINGINNTVDGYPRGSSSGGLSVLVSASRASPYPGSGSRATTPAPATASSNSWGQDTGGLGIYGGRAVWLMRCVGVHGSCVCCGHAHSLDPGPSLFL